MADETNLEDLKTGICRRKVFICFPVNFRQECPRSGMVYLRYYRGQWEGPAILIDSVVQEDRIPKTLVLVALLS